MEAMMGEVQVRSISRVPETVQVPDLFLQDVCTMIQSETMLYSPTVVLILPAVAW